MVIRFSTGRSWTEMRKAFGVTVVRVIRLFAYAMCHSRLWLKFSGLVFKGVPTIETVGWYEMLRVVVFIKFEHGNNFCEMPPPKKVRVRRMR